MSFPIYLIDLMIVWFMYYYLSWNLIFFEHILIIYFYIWNMNSMQWIVRSRMIYWFLPFSGYIIFIIYHRACLFISLNLQISNVIFFIYLWWNWIDYRLNILLSYSSWFDRFHMSLILLLKRFLQRVFFIKSIMFLLISSILFILGKLRFLI